MYKEVQAVLEVFMEDWGQDAAAMHNKYCDKMGSVLSSTKPAPCTDLDKLIPTSQASVSSTWGH